MGFLVLIFHLLISNVALSFGHHHPSTTAAASSSRKQGTLLLHYGNLDRIPEWNALEPASQEELKHLLSEESLSTFDYPACMFQVDKLTKGHSLLFISWAIFSSLPDDDEYPIAPDALLEFTRKVEGCYMDKNPYHNHVHAADVLQTVHSLIVSTTRRQQEGQPYYSSLDVLSIYLAAMLHDVGHDGTTNEFQIQQQTPLAIQYSNQSVLEQFHFDLGWKQVEATGLLQNLSMQEQELIQHKVSDAILHTDMSFHQAQVEAYPNVTNSWDRLVFWLHLADISNAAKSTFLIWTDHVLEEFFLLGDYQDSLNLPVNFDRRTAKRGAIQEGFVQSIVLPAFEAVMTTTGTGNDFLLSNDDDENAMTIILERLRRNFDYWKAQAAAEEQQAAKQ